MSIGVAPAFVNCACNLHPNEKHADQCVIDDRLTSLPPIFKNIIHFSLYLNFLLSCCRVFVIATLDNNKWHMSP